MFTASYMAQMLRRGESGTSALIGQTRTYVVNFLVLMLFFVFTRHNANANTRKGKKIDPYTCAWACAHACVEALSTVK